MANFNQSNNPVYVQTTSKLTKPVLKAIKLVASNTKLLKQERIDLIKVYPNVRTAVERFENELMVVTNGELSTQYFIPFPYTRLELTIEA